MVDAKITRADEGDRHWTANGVMAERCREWVVRKTAVGNTRSGRTVARETVLGDGFDALAAAHNRALAKMSDDIGAAIRVEAESQP